MPKNSTPRSPVIRLAEGLSLYTIARCAGGVVRLLSVPFIVHAVSAEAFGTLATLWMPLFIVHGVCDLGIGTAAVRLAPECQTASSRRSLFATLMSARFGLGLFVSAFVILFHEPLARWVTGSPNNGWALLWLALTRPMGVVFDALLDELRSRAAMRQVSAVTLFMTCVAQGLSIAFTVWLGFGLKGLVWARILAEALAFVAAGALCFRFVVGRPSLHSLRRLLAFGWPLGMVYLLMTLRGLDRPLIRALSSLGHVAAYELAMRMVGPVGVFNIALGMVLEPFVYGHAGSRETPRFVDLFVRAYVVVIGTVAMLLGMAGPELVTLFAPAAYHGAIRVLPGLVFSTTCEGLQRAAGIGADLAKRTRVWAVASIATLSVGLTFAAVLVPRVGLAGAGVAWFVANAVSTLLVYGVARNLSGIVLPVGRGLALLGAGGLVATAGAWSPWPLSWRAGAVLGFFVLAKSVMSFRWADVKTAASV